MSKKEIGKLSVTIQQLKKSLSRIDRYLGEHENEQICDFLIKQLQGRKDILEGNFKTFQDIQTQLIYLDPESEDHSEEFENFYFDILSKINLKISENHDVNSVNNQLVQNSVNNQVVQNASAPKENVSPVSTAKLPHINIPIFDGKDLNNFKPFIEMFSAVIDKNATLSDVEKLFYLRNYLRGEALALISTLPIVKAHIQKPCKF